MGRPVAIAWLGAAVAVAALQACSEGFENEDVAVQRLETRMCEKALACDCPPRLDDFGMPEACGGWELAQASDQDSWYRLELAFDPACVDRWVQWVDALPCGAARLPSFAALCPLYHGTLREGEDCGEEQVSPLYSVCDRGLFCLAGRCRDPLRTPLGMQGEPCDRGERCDDGLVCASSGCERLPGAGEPCDLGECREDAFCSLDPATGDSMCRLIGDVGEPCSGHRQCASGNCPAGVCEPPAEAGEPCSFQLPCGPGLACVGDRCQGAACFLLEEL